MVQKGMTVMNMQRVPTLDLEHTDVDVTKVTQETERFDVTVSTMVWDLNFAYVLKLNNVVAVYF